MQYGVFFCSIVRSKIMKKWTKIMMCSKTAVWCVFLQRSTQCVFLQRSTEYMYMKKSEKFLCGFWKPQLHDHTKKEELSFNSRSSVFFYFIYGIWDFRVFLYMRPKGAEILGFFSQKWKKSVIFLYMEKCSEKTLGNMIRAFHECFRDHPDGFFD